MNVYVGTSGYSYKEWKGKFYPADLPATKMLHYYGEHFRAVEINGTFRSMPKPEVLQAWAAEVPAGFKFALKAPQRITHIRRLNDVAEPLADLIELAGELGKRLAPFLFQLPPNFKKNLPRLQEFLALLPPKCRATFEFRHPSWFEDDVFDALRARRAALCISDEVADLPVPFKATADWGYLRLRRTNYDNAALKKWLAQVKRQKWKDVFVFFKHEDEATGPTLAAKFVELAG
jgi:uncharacterized protein YecE (DUF72 family)